MSSPLANIYARLPVSFTHGQGVWLWDAGGRKYLDALAGIGVSCLGHAHPMLVAAIAEQAARVIHTSNIYDIPQQTELAARLTALSGMQEVAFNNSGSEANEAAIKLARKWGRRNRDGAGSGAAAGVATRKPHCGPRRAGARAGSPGRRIGLECP